MRAGGTAHYSWPTTWHRSEPDGHARMPSYPCSAKDIRGQSRPFGLGSRRGEARGAEGDARQPLAAGQGESINLTGPDI